MLTYTLERIGKLLSLARVRLAYICLTNQFIKIMKFKNLAVAVLLITGFSMTSCRDTETKETTVVKEVEVESDDNEREGILERTAKEVDKEVNEEIDEELREI